MYRQTTRHVCVVGCLLSVAGNCAVETVYLGVHYCVPR